jgi:hypothetical protein
MVLSQASIAGINAALQLVEMDELEFDYGFGGLKVCFVLVKAYFSEQLTPKLLSLSASQKYIEQLKGRAEALL